MADNVNITAGAGVVIHADEYTHTTLGAGKTQLVKLVDGTLDSDTPITVDIGAKANALRVAPANNITDGTYIGDIKFGEALTTVTTVSTVTNLAQMGGVAIAMNEGVLAAGVQRVTLATDDDAVAHLATIAGDTTNIETAIQLLDNAVYVDDADWTDNTSSHLLVGGVYQSTDHTVTDGDVSPFQVDANGCIVLGTGSKAIGKLAANTGVDIGDVDVTSVPAPLNVVGGGTEAAALRVTIANDSTGVITVDGTVTANLSATDNTVLDNIDSDTNDIKTAVELLDNAVDGNFLNCNMCLAGNDAVAGEGVIDSNTLRVTVATDDDGVAHLATIAGDTTNIETAIQIIDDWDATHASAAPADGVQVMGAGYSAGLPTDVGADADAARICTDRHGRVLAGRMPQNFQATMTSADAQSATPVKTKTADRKMYILSLVVSTDTAMNIQFQDDTGPTVLIEQLYLAANGGAHLTWPPEAPLVVNTNEDFDVIASAAGNISVTITGYLAV